jgi:hypothetical protein
VPEPVSLSHENGFLVQRRGFRPAQLENQELLVVPPNCLVRDAVDFLGMTILLLDSYQMLIRTADIMLRAFCSHSRDLPMPRENSDTSSDWNQRQRALSRWDDEGGAGPDGPATASAPDDERIAIPELTNAELVTLRIRVIALENLMISLLATASDDQLKLAREMAGYISPRPGFTQHPLTIHAAAHMVDLVERANRFRDFES